MFEYIFVIDAGDGGYHELTTPGFYILTSCRHNTNNKA